MGCCWLLIPRIQLLYTWYVTTITGTIILMICFYLPGDSSGTVRLGQNLSRFHCLFSYRSHTPNPRALSRATYRGDTVVVERLDAC